MIIFEGQNDLNYLKNKTFPSVAALSTEIEKRGYDVLTVRDDKIAIMDEAESDNMVEEYNLIRKSGRVGINLSHYNRYKW